MSLLATLRRKRTDSPTPSNASLPERLVSRTAAVLGGTHSRRRFLARTAVVGSALATDPLGYVLKPGTAHGAVCGSCGDGWTAFCCTINSGKNSCPPGSFVAGWWKADNAAYCCSRARYIIDCNATCPTSCSCRCSGASCDGRRTCCNQFRYPGCSQNVSCAGPVVCRVAICIPPWVYSRACTSSSATDNRTRDHGSTCLSAECDSAITRRYYALGGPNHYLGNRTHGEGPSPQYRGRVAHYQRGRIYWSSRTGAWEVWGPIFNSWASFQGSVGRYGFPTTGVGITRDRTTRWQDFQGGRIYAGPRGVHPVPEPINAKHIAYGGVNGVFRYPTSPERRSMDRRSIYMNFQYGRVYRIGTKVIALPNPFFAYHEALGGVYGKLGYPATDPATQADGRGRAIIFDRGVMYMTPTTRPSGLWGRCLQAYLRNGGAGYTIGYPLTDVEKVPDGRGETATFENAAVYATPQTGGHIVEKPLLDAYLERGGPTGRLGYPRTSMVKEGRYHHVVFEGGRLTLDTATGAITEG